MVSACFRLTPCGFFLAAAAAAAATEVAEAATGATTGETTGGCALFITAFVLLVEGVAVLVGMSNSDEAGSPVLEVIDMDLTGLDDFFVEGVVPC